MQHKTSVPSFTDLDDPPNSLSHDGDIDSAACFNALDHSGQHEMHLSSRHLPDLMSGQAQDSDDYNSLQELLGGLSGVCPTSVKDKLNLIQILIVST